MNEIIATLSALSPHLTPRTLKQLTIIVEAMMAMTGRVTMRGLSRWAEKGGSYRTVQRFFKEEMGWPTLRWQLIKQHLTGTKSVWLMVGDEVTVTKSGKETHGLGVFFLRFTTRRSPACAFRTCH
jgi:putative transposase